MGLPASDPARIFGIGLKAMRAQLRESLAEPETKEPFARDRAGGTRQTVLSDEEREARFAAQADAQVQAKFAAKNAEE
jgi:hypothetical protein